MQGERSATGRDSDRQEFRGYFLLELAQHRLSVELGRLAGSTPLDSGSPCINYLTWADDPLFRTLAKRLCECGMAAAPAMQHTPTATVREFTLWEELSVRSVRMISSSGRE